MCQDQTRLQMKKLLATLVFALSGLSYAASHCDQFVPYGYPQITGRPDAVQLCRISYMVVQDVKLKTPIYAVELLLPENISGVNPRVNAFKPDPDLSYNEQGSKQDYVSTNYDKGHLAPVEDMRKDSAAMLQSFYMSNVVPQYNKLNRGAWKALEDHARKQALKYDGVYVFTGPVFAARPIMTIGNDLAVPSHMFKVIIDKANGQSIGYIIPNTNTSGLKYRQFALPVIEVERVTGINFTPTLNSNQDGFKRTIGRDLE